MTSLLIDYLPLAIVLLVIGWLLNNLISNSETRGITTSLDWLDRRAGFEISDL